MKKVGVVYLMWVPFGIEYFRAFINSYRQYEAGLDHTLIVYFNGCDNNFDIGEYMGILRLNNLEALTFESPAGQDIDCYLDAARSTDFDYLLFFNTYTNFRDHQWLHKYFSAINNKNVGVIGSTASLQSYYSSVYQKNKWYWEFDKSFTDNYRKYKLFIKAFVYWRWLFSPFPNPHVRTTGFMVRVKDLLDMNPGYIGSKFNAYLFENGRRSLTNYFLKKGKKALVMDRFGRTYEPRQWSISCTFWISDQENLMVGDNQTAIYQEADEDERKKMTELAWGKQ